MRTRRFFTRRCNPFGVVPPYHHPLTSTIRYLEAQAEQVNTSRRLRHPHLLAGISVAAVLAACTDDPAAPVPTVSGAPGYQLTTNVEPQAEFDHRPSFELDVQAVGSFKPGHPIHLTFTASAVKSVADGELRVTLPEVVSAEESGWDVVLVPTGEVLRPHLQVRQAFAEGERARERITVRIPEPGYYLVAATGYRHRSEAEPGKLTDVSRRDYWLWIAEHGGKLTATMDTTVFSPDDRKQRGPVGSQRRASRLRSADASIECTLLPGDGVVIQSSPCPQDPGIGITPTPPPSPSATHTFRVLYDKSSYGVSQRPVPGARYIWSVTSSTGAAVSTGNGFVGADGSIPTIDCQGSTTDRRVTLNVYTLNEKAIVRYQNNERAGGAATSCGGPTNVYLDPEMAHLFLNTVKIYDGHRIHFPFPTIPRIEAGLYDDGRTYYHHDSTNGELHMAKLPQMIYSEDGVMFVTHEYGHHYQDRYLFTPGDGDGLMRFTRDCRELHPPESSSNFGCALGEAFADWYAVVVRENELPDWRWRMEDNWFYRNCVGGNTPRGQITCTSDGSIVQGAVAAMLWDILMVGASRTTGLTGIPRMSREG